ncbi:MAG: DNA polymerase III subunit alpha [Candidatus Saccharimonadales bacterium]
MAQRKITAKDFVHLHNHTQYSLLDGLTKIPDLMDTVKDLGMDAIAITDHGTLSGLVEFYKEARSKSIKPLLGIETYLAARKLTDKEPSLDKENFHLILIAMNNTGYQNLMQLSTIANLEGYYYKPRIDRQTLAKYSDGLICLSGCMGSEIGQSLSQGLYKQALEIAKWYKRTFKDRYYLEIQDHGHPQHPTYNTEQEVINNQLLKMSKELAIPVVVTADAHYLKHQDQTAHEILLCIQTNAYFSDKNRMTLSNLELHVTDPREIIKRWASDYPEVITNTKLLSESCEVTLPLGKILIPKFPLPAGQNEKSYLNLLVYRGIAWRYGRQDRDKASKLTIEQAKKFITKDVANRADYELSVIHSMGFSGYFLIVQDLINWGKNHKVIFGPGRGSAAGSIVSYALRITEIDPIKYSLMFERFLNPSRVSMPDIDIDIQDTRRDEVIEYCVHKYGREKVANIVTFGKMAARNAVRDVSRVLEVPYAEADRLAKMLPLPVQGRHIPLKKSLQSEAQLKTEYKTNETARKVFDLAIQLEGTIRNHGVHAAGVVIAPNDIVNFTPLEMAQKGVVATQYSMGPIDELGLLKIDFLGLSNLTTIRNAQRIVRRVYKDSINIDELPNDDQLTFDLLKRADTVGVFQLESAGMKRYLKELQPTMFTDIIAMNALYRPGPMSEIPRFIEGKNNPSSINYLHQSLEPILKDTYGVMVYQEQIIQILQRVAGYSPGEADLVRKAIGKKKRDILQAEEPKFIAGALKQGLSEKQAKQLWSQIQPFADYSFPKAHATCYAQISYWTAYLKAHYPDAFMAAVMTTDYDNIDRLAIEIAECRHLNIDVLAPDINESFVEFGIVPKKNQIRFGFKAIKNVGTAAAEAIVEARGEKPFKSLEDYLTRVNARTVNKKALESLIKTGAFDRFYDRTLLLNNIDLMVAYAAKHQKQKESNQLNLFSEKNSKDEALISTKLNLDKTKNSSSENLYLNWERELLGIYLSQHPLAGLSNYFKQNCVALNEVNKMTNDSPVTVGGLIVEIKIVNTKSGQRMAFMRIEDLTSDIEMVVFPKTYTQYASYLSRDKIYKFHARVSSRTSSVTDNNKSLVLESLEPIESSAYKSNKHDPDDPKLFIKLNDTSDDKLLTNLKETIDKYVGDTKVILVLDEMNARQAIRLPNGFDHQNQEAIDHLQKIVGIENLAIN